MGESYMYQRLPYARGEGEGEDEEERNRSVGGQMVTSEVVGGWMDVQRFCVQYYSVFRCVRVFFLSFLYSHRAEAAHHLSDDRQLLNSVFWRTKCWMSTTLDKTCS